MGSANFTDYEYIAASQVNEPIGEGAAKSEIVDKINIFPTTTSPGQVVLRDGSAGSDMVVFEGGADSIASLRPITIVLGVRSRDKEGWHIDTGANMNVLAVGSLR